jgi:NAD(P)-dependent dehydrogenase (short-subunit alcohol dehydrogenase family)
MAVEQAKEELLREKQPMLAFSTPEGIGALAVFLCSDGAATMTGTALPIDGGVDGAVAPRTPVPSRTPHNRQSATRWRGRSHYAKHAQRKHMHQESYRDWFSASQHHIHEEQIEGPNP